MSEKQSPNAAPTLASINTKIDKLLQRSAGSGVLQQRQIRMWAAIKDIKENTVSGGSRRRKSRRRKRKSTKKKRRKKRKRTKKKRRRRRR